MKRLFALVLAVTCIFGYSNVSASSNIISISNETDFRTAVTQGGNSTWKFENDIEVDLKDKDFTESFKIPENVTIKGNNFKLSFKNYPETYYSVLETTQNSKNFVVNDLTIVAPLKKGFYKTPALISFSDAKTTFNNVDILGNDTGTWKSGYGLYFGGNDTQVEFNDVSINRGRLNFQKNTNGKVKFNKTVIDHREFVKRDENDEVFFHSPNAMWGFDVIDSKISLDAKMTYSLSNGSQRLGKLLFVDIPNDFEIRSEWQINTSNDFLKAINSNLSNQTLVLNEDITLPDLTEKSSHYKIADNTTIIGNDKTISFQNMHQQASKVFSVLGSLTISDLNIEAPDKSDKGEKVYYTPTLFSFEGKQAPTITFDNVELKLNKQTKNPGLALYFSGKDMKVNFKDASMLNARLLFQASTGELTLDNTLIRNTDPYKDSLKDEVVFMADNAQWKMNALNSTITFDADTINNEYKTYDNLETVLATLNKIKGINLNLEFVNKDIKVKPDTNVQDKIAGMIDTKKTTVSYSQNSFYQKVKIAFNETTLSDSIKQSGIDNIKALFEKNGFNLGKLFVFDISALSLSDDQQVAANEGASIDISLPIPEFFKGVENLVVIHIAEDGTIEELPTTIENKVITFNTSHFSNFALAEKRETTKVDEDKDNKPSDKQDKEQGEQPSDEITGKLPKTGLNSIQLPIIVVLACISLLGVNTVRNTRNRQN